MQEGTMKNFITGQPIEGIQDKVRLHYLDWLRVFAFVAVFFYHCGRFFNESDWHIKNSTTSTFADTLMSFFELWGMPMIFLISGASIYLALRPRGTIRFLRERVLRLLVPLAFGILILSPPQKYLERLTHGQFQGSFLEYLPIYFRDWNQWNGEFEWAGVHLWYLAYLFLFTLVLLPLFAVLKTSNGQRLTGFLAQISTQRGVIFLWVLPGIVLILLSDPFGFMSPAPPEAVSRLLFSIFVIYGFLMFSDPRIRQAIIQQRRIALILAFVLTLTLPKITSLLENDPSLLIYTLGMALTGMLMWTCLLAALGYGMHYLNANHRLLAYANEGVLPFYILHQPVILIIGYFIIFLSLPILAKYLIIAPIAFAITLGIYEFGIRRVNPMRRLLGLKSRSPVIQATEQAAQPL
jgi:peptidoglycan/LPS O-acetylase OafA/YrhL